MTVLLRDLDAAPPSRVPPLPRVNLYGVVHRGLRLAHARLLTRLGATSYVDRTSVELTLDGLETMLELSAFHLDAEERHLHPALEARRASSSDRLTRQHAEHERSFAELRTLAVKLSAARTDAAPAVGRALYLRYATFVADDLTHMAEEELVIEPLFHELYTQDELGALRDALVDAIPPREWLEFLRLMVPASNHEERVALVSELERQLPEAAFRGVAAALRGPLGEAEHARLFAAL